MSLPMPAKSRITRELSLLSKDPPPGIACYPAPTPSTSASSSISSGRLEFERLTHLHATITGPPSSPFSKGIFLVTIRIPPRYPFEPPRIRFRTPLHHPNIDSSGRICLDTLKSPPAGCWSPAVSLPSLLLTIRTLLGEPNADDGLVPEVTRQFGRDYEGWWREAEEMARKEATEEKLRLMEDGVMPVAVAATVVATVVGDSEDCNKADSVTKDTRNASKKDTNLKRSIDQSLQDEDQNNGTQCSKDRTIKSRLL